MKDRGQNLNRKSRYFLNLGQSSFQSLRLSQHTITLLYYFFIHSEKKKLSFFVLVLTLLRCRKYDYGYTLSREIMSSTVFIQIPVYSQFLNKSNLKITWTAMYRQMSAIEIFTLDPKIMVAKDCAKLEHCRNVKHMYTHPTKCIQNPNFGQVCVSRATNNPSSDMRHSTVTIPQIPQMSPYISGKYLRKGAKNPFIPTRTMWLWVEHSCMSPRRRARARQLLLLVSRAEWTGC